MSQEQLREVHLALIGRESHQASILSLYCFLPLLLPDFSRYPPQQACFSRSGLCMLWVATTHVYMGDGSSFSSFWLCQLCSLVQGDSSLGHCSSPDPICCGRSGKKSQDRYMVDCVHLFSKSWGDSSKGEGVIWLRTQRLSTTPL